MRFNLPVFETTIESSRSSDRGFSMVADLVCLLKKAQAQYQIGVSLSSFIRQAIALRDSWMSETSTRGRHCTLPNHWPRNLFAYPPSEAEFPAEVAELFDDDRPWFDVIDGIP